MADLTAMMQAAAGAAGGENLYIEDVFSTYLFTGNDSTQTITNGIDLNGEGGLVWTKNRTNAYNHTLYDTVRGINNSLISNSTASASASNNTLTAFNSNGFTLGAGGNDNASSTNIVSWTFRKAPKFFDIVTYTGDGTSPRAISHNLESAPGCVIIKQTDVSNDWCVWHTARGNDQSGALNTTGAFGTFTQRIKSVTSTTFSVGNSSTVNDSGATYVAYLFAHDAGGFGDDGSENVITCGSFTTDGSGNATVTLGYEPQWFLIKRTNGSDPWYLLDTMRGFTVAADAFLQPNTSDAESLLSGFGYPTATGWSNVGDNTQFFTSSTYIYIAIRRGPMKTPTAGTEVLGAYTRSGTDAEVSITGTGYPIDLSIDMSRSAYQFWLWVDRLRGNNRTIYSNDTSAESGGITRTIAGNNNNVNLIIPAGDNPSGVNFVNYFFRRAPGFFDVVAYTGNGATRTVAHNLTVVPELIIVKKRSTSIGDDNWMVYHTGLTQLTQYALYLNDPSETIDMFGGVWGAYNTAISFTSTAFNLGNNANVNLSSSTYVAYLFASLAGVSDIGTYTGNGTSVTVTTGFQPRFILVKRTDFTGNWIVGDSARGLVAGDDPFLLLNSTAAETTNQDWVDISATGFTVNETAANANVNTGTYIYLAIA